MTIKTLEYIHNLLLKEKQIAKEAFDEARALANRYEPGETSKELIKKRNDSANRRYEEYSAATDVLREFENTNWQ